MASSIRTIAEACHGQQIGSRGPFGSGFPEAGENAFISVDATTTTRAAGAVSVATLRTAASFERGDRVDGRGRDDGREPDATENQADACAHRRPKGITQSAEQPSEPQHHGERDGQQERGCQAPGEAASDPVAMHRLPDGKGVGRGRNEADTEVLIVGDRGTGSQELPAFGAATLRSAAAAQLPCRL